jgi:hypothetical protein
MARQQRSKRRKPLGELSRQDELTDEARDALAKKMCGEKKRFATQGEAGRLAAEYGLGIYKCPVCGGWHFTSKP